MDPDMEGVKPGTLSTDRRLPFLVSLSRHTWCVESIVSKSLYCYHIRIVVVYCVFSVVFYIVTVSLFCVAVYVNSITVNVISCKDLSG